MNYMDIVVIILLLLYVLSGLYRGFLPSLMNLGAFFVSWIASFLAYPLLSHSITNSPLFGSFRTYIEGAEYVGNFELAKTSISSLSQTQIDTLMQNAKVPAPFNTAILQNIKTAAFQEQGLTTVGEYFDATIYNVIINIFAILILFVCIRVILTVLTNAYAYARPLPELRHFDHPVGGAMGLLRGYFSMYLVFSFVPIMLIFLPISLVTDMVNSSFMSKIFYSSSIILRFVSGVA